MKNPRDESDNFSENELLAESMQLNGEHTPPACGIRRLAEYFQSPFFPRQTVEEKLVF